MIVDYSNQFKKDYKKLVSQGKDITKLKNIIEKLLRNQPLEKKYKDHKLSGEWKGFRDCHIEPDWLLIYRKTSEVLYIERTGSHSELFR